MRRERDARASMSEGPIGNRMDPPCIALPARYAHRARRLLATFDCEPVRDTRDALDLTRQLERP